VIAFVLIIFGMNRPKVWLSNYVRELALNTLRSDFSGEVEVGNIHVSVFPHVAISGTDLVIREPGRPDIPPLIRVKEFSTEAAAWQLLRGGRHIGKITLKGLVIVTPPPSERPADTVVTRPRRHRPPFRVRVDQIIADGAELDVLPTDPTKSPHVFHIRRLNLHNAGLGQAMTYEATLTNPVPVGEIQSRGEFGPWQAGDPRRTPLRGTYTFTHADLASIHGLSGTLSSQGRFEGRLDSIDIHGATDTPDFSLGISGHPVPLETRFHANVDGSTGDTVLDEVRAKLLDSEITAHGGIVRTPGQSHRRILLDATSRNARLEDLLRLALKADKPPMVGVISFRSRIDIPPGKQTVADRLRLDGEFSIDSARFAHLNVQQKVEKLSRRGRGRIDGDQEGEGPGSVASDFSGRFALRDSMMTFSNLKFAVPGASVNLNGTYAMHGEEVDFRGTLALQATLSQMTRGWKAALLRPLDPIFEKHGAGTLLPVTIAGTESDPKFGVDIRRVF
jgi:hypothetical protein